MQIRVDTGGTFTDAWARDEQGQESRCKVLSSGELRLAIEEVRGDMVKLRCDGLPEAADLVGFQVSGGGHVKDWRAGWAKLSQPVAESAEVLELSSGEEAPVLAVRLLTGVRLGSQFPAMDLRVATTRGTNALLERKGARLALWTNHGLEDLLEIRDQRRKDIFDSSEPRRAILPERIYTTKARLDKDGGELAGVDEKMIRDQAREALSAGIEVAAVALMHSYKNSAHEQAVSELLVEEGFSIVTCSADVAPSIKLLPRMETALANAWLAPVMNHFVQRLCEPLGQQEPWLMTSSGSLALPEKYQPKDSLLSGPAGGLVGAAAVARSAGFGQILTFDMGGTSTDVARVSGDFVYRYQQEIGSAWVLAPSLCIETVAAGGSSICQWRRGGLEVGPDSAGASPGPACYGRGGPLTLTDVNLLLGLMDSKKAGIPLCLDAAKDALAELRECMAQDVESMPTEQDLLEGLRRIAIERMADTIRTVSVREGYDPSDHALLAFGGAGPQHACELAERLGMDTVVVPSDCGLLSAYGLHCAVREVIKEQQVLLPLEECEGNWPVWWDKLECDAMSEFPEETQENELVFRRLVEVRLVGQETPLELIFSDQLELDFMEAYSSIYGYAPEGVDLEVVMIRLVLSESAEERLEEGFAGTEIISGPTLLQDAFSTCSISDGWEGQFGDTGTLLLRKKLEIKNQNTVAFEVEAELYRNRFESIVADMGELLRRTAISTNVKERLDYSCALLNAEGELIVNAPHIPVHLGALGVCVRSVMAYYAPAGGLEDGDMVVVNHPGYGGSHLPDITLISPVFDLSNRILMWVANRAHHSEVGGSAPGSMPADASSLEEEGVVLAPQYLFRKGKERFSEIACLFRDAAYPTRNLSDNLADLRAQAAANLLGVKQARDLYLGGSGDAIDVVKTHMKALTDRSAMLMKRKIVSTGVFSIKDTAKLDCGAKIKLNLSSDGELVRFDFTGSSAVQDSNLNATEAIVRSVVLYAVRLWVGDSLPLNEGLLRDVEIVLPNCFLHPEFSSDLTKCPAVVGGNVEVSQQLVDLVLYSLGIQAESQGTMNNLLFGNTNFGYYETIAGGAGAGVAAAGCSARQVHMTNTAMTDPELMEWRYPVRVHHYGHRVGSGGSGVHQGGDGVTRELEFLDEVVISLLTNRRKKGARGLHGGSAGSSGRQSLLRRGEEIDLPSRTTFRTEVGDFLKLETPGGGGCGDLNNIC